MLGHRVHMNRYHPVYYDDVHYLDISNTCVSISDLIFALIVHPVHAEPTGNHSVMLLNVVEFLFSSL